MWLWWYCSTQEVDDEIAKVQQKMTDDFVTWIPNNIKSSIITVPPQGTALDSVFQRICAQFGKLYKRKAFLHWYKGEGMDEVEFQKCTLCVCYVRRRDWGLWSLFCVVCAPKQWRLVVDSYSSIEKMLRLS